MRNLKKQLEKIYRKAALKLVQAGAVPEAQRDDSGKQQDDQVLEASQEGDQQPGGSGQEPDGQQAETLSATDSLVREVMGSGTPASAEPHADTPDSANGAIQDRGSRAQQLAEGAEGAAATVFAEPAVVIDEGDLKEYVGQPPYPTDKIYAEGTPAGEPAPAWPRLPRWRAAAAGFLFFDAACTAMHVHAHICCLAPLLRMVRFLPLLRPPGHCCRSCDGLGMDGAGRQHFVRGGCQRGAGRRQGRLEGHRWAAPMVDRLLRPRWLRAAAADIPSTALPDP